MKNKGKVFEVDFKDSCDETDHLFIRLIDSAKWVQGQGSKFTPSNIADSILHGLPFLFVLELKSREGSGISFYKDTPWEKPTGTTSQVMIKHTQVKTLMKVVEKEGIIAGFVLNYRERTLKKKSEPNETFFVHINDFINFAKESGAASISREQAREIGIEIEGTKKKTHYKYNIDKFIDDAVQFYIGKGYIKQETLNQLRDWIVSIT